MSPGLKEKKKRICEAPCLKSKFQTGLGDGDGLVGDVLAVQHEDLSLGPPLNPCRKSGVAARICNASAGGSGEEMAGPESSLVSHSS